MNLYQDGIQLGELDLAGWNGQSLFAAEAKSSSFGFDTADIAADIEKGARVGIDTFVMVCPEGVSSDAKSRAEAAAEKHQLKLRILAGTELLAES